MEAEPLLNDAILAEKLQKDPELKKYYYQEQLILEVTELIAKLMQKYNVNKSELAKRLGKGRSHVTQLLDGTSNMTLRTISDVFVVLDSMLVVKAGPLSLEFGQAYEESDYEFEDTSQVMQSGISPEALPKKYFTNDPSDRMVA